MNLKTNTAIRYLLLSLFIVIFSVPLANLTLNTFYSNLGTEYLPFFIGFTTSYLVLGILIYSLAMRMINKEL